MHIRKKNMVEEKVLFRRNDICVTPTRFMVGSKTYAIRNIVSTKGIEVRPGCLGALLGNRTEYRVILTTSAGEVGAYSSFDPEIVDKLLGALDMAIVGE
jgi:hypothetical protein